VSQLVQAGLDRSPIQPALGFLTFSLLGSGPSQTDLNRKFLGSRRITDYLCDHPAEARVMGSKDLLDFQPPIAGFGSGDGFKECIHVAMSPPEPIL
jgi:hypothetical protein